jgi:hypothetical protein
LVPAVELEDDHLQGLAFDLLGGIPEEFCDVLVERNFGSGSWWLLQGFIDSHMIASVVCHRFDWGDLTRVRYPGSLAQAVRADDQTGS